MQENRFVEFTSTSKNGEPIAREVVLRALWNAAGEDRTSAPSKEQLEALVRGDTVIKYLSSRYLHVQFTEEYPIMDMQSYDEYYGTGAGKAVFDDLLEKPLVKQLCLKEFLKRRYDRAKAKRTRERNRKRKAEGLPPFLDSRLRVSTRPYNYTGKHIGKNGKRPRKFLGKHRDKMDKALVDRIREGKVDVKWSVPHQAPARGEAYEV